MKIPVGRGDFFCFLKSYIVIVYFLQILPISATITALYDVYDMLSWIETKDNSRIITPSVWNWANSVQEAFVEKAFCIVWYEMKAKIEALGLSEDDIAEISFENKNWEYLEFIDTYFGELIAIKSCLWKENKEIVRRLGENPPKAVMDASLKIAFRDTKRELLGKITLYKELSILFSRFPAEGVAVIISCIEKDRFFDLIIALKSWIEKYQFDWNLLIEFFEKVPRELRASMSDQSDTIRSIQLLIETYQYLSGLIGNTIVFDDLLKLCISTGKDNYIYLLNALKNFDIPDDLVMLRKYYPELIRLWLIAWKNSPIVLTHPSHKLSFLNRKDKDLIISTHWVENPVTSVRL